MTTKSHSTCVGMLYCGDLGAALARTLIKNNIRVVTTCQGRSAQTIARAENAKVSILPTLDEVVAEADILISVVLPDAAETVARQCAESARLLQKSCLFVDANSIGLDVLAAIQDVVQSAGLRFIDAAVHGGAARLEQLGVIYLSGGYIDEIEPLFSSAMRVFCLGDQVGQATRMKLLMAGQSKCLNLLYLQIATLAHRAGMLDTFLDESRTFYPEIMTAIDRMLPTYPQHALRRVAEMQGIERFAESVSAPHEIIRAARELLQSAARAWNNEAEPLDVSSVVKLADPSPSLSEENTI